jgi:hypothetical protein
MFERDKVDMIVGNVSTASALAAMEVAEQFKKVSIVTGAASLQITNEKCTKLRICLAPVQCSLRGLTGTIKAFNWLYSQTKPAYKLISSCVNVV